jgi:hypothetical protein
LNIDLKEVQISFYKKNEDKLIKYFHFCVMAESKQLFHISEENNFLNVIWAYDLLEKIKIDHYHFINQFLNLISFLLEVDY